MKISVIIPAHNEEKTIEQTLTAVFAQNYPDFEVIVVDNASTDRTADVVRAFGKKRSPQLRLIREDRKGVPSAREAGRLAATGEIIANIDADCLPEPDWLSRGARHFDRNDVAAVSGPYDYHDGSRSFRTLSLFFQRNAYTPVNFLLQMPSLRLGAIAIGGNTLIRGSVLEKMGGYDTSIIFNGEDMDMAKRAAKHGRIVFSRDLIMKTSARRFKSEGMIGNTAKYWLYFFKIIFSK